MTTPPAPGPDHPDGFDWRAAEADLTAPADATTTLHPGRADDATSGGQATHFAVALDDEPTPGGAPVAPVPPALSGPRPVIPPSLHGWVNIKHTVTTRLRLLGYHAAFHGVRAPWYAVQAAFWATVGVFRLLNRQRRWWWLTEQYGLRQHAADAGDWHAWHKLHREVKSTRAWRGFVLACEAAGLAIGAPVAYALTPGWALTLAGAAGIAGLAHLGRPADRPIVSRAVVTGRYRQLTPDIVLRAYYAAKLGNPDKDHLQVKFGGPMSRDANNTGSQVTVDLPYGTTWDDVVKAKGAIASGLDVSINQVFLSKGDTHRRHVLFVADRDPLAIPAGRTPLLDCKVRDIWTEAPLGLDERGRKVSLLLLWISILIGAQPRKGKTFTTRLPALFAALDPYVRLCIVDGKMSPDWDKFRLVAHRYVCGTVPNSRDNDPIEHFLDMLREIKAHIQEVNDLLAKLPTAECPEGKLTRELSRKYEQLRVWVLVMEEFQNYFETDDQDTNKEIASLLSYIMAVGPSAGVTILSSSQKPSGVGAGDVARLFNRYRDNHAVRFALKCGNRIVSEAILGGDAYAEGFDASALPVGKQYLGVGILYGASDDTATVRTHLADHEDAERILIAARKHREAAGTLSGYATGEQITRDLRDTLADVRSVFEAGEPGLHWEHIAERLAARYPEHYGDISPEAASAMVRKHVRSVQVKVNGINRAGVRYAHICDAIDKRDRS